MKTTVDLIITLVLGTNFVQKHGRVGRLIAAKMQIGPQLCRFEPNRSKNRRPKKLSFYSKF